MNGVPAGASSEPARSLTMPAQAEAAGDQMTGASPLTSGFGQPSTMRLAALPDATLRGRTKMHRPFASAPLSLNSSASVWRRVIFSLLTAMSTTMQSPVSSLSPPPGSVPGSAESSSSPQAPTTPIARSKARPSTRRRGVVEEAFNVTSSPIGFT